MAWIDDKIEETTKQLKTERISKWRAKIRQNEQAAWHHLRETKLQKSVSFLSKGSADALSEAELFEHVETYWRKIWPADLPDDVLQHMADKHDTAPCGPDPSPLAGAFSQELT